MNGCTEPAPSVPATTLPYRNLFGFIPAGTKGVLFVTVPAGTFCDSNANIAHWRKLRTALDAGGLPQLALVVLDSDVRLQLLSDVDLKELGLMRLHAEDNITDEDGRTA